MAYASEALINEHSWLIKGSEILEDMTEELERGVTVEVEDLRQITMFFQLFAEKCHYLKEEEYYFEVVRSHTTEFKGLLDHLVGEHQLGRTQLKMMERAVDCEPLDTQEFIKAAYGYIGILRGHIEAEQYELFPLGNEIIPKEKQERLLRLFQRFDCEILGDDAYEKMYSTFKILEERYSRSSLQSDDHTYDQGPGRNESRIGKIRYYQET